MAVPGTPGRSPGVAGMIGTIVHQELLLGGRRNRLHFVRWAYGAWLNERPERRLRREPV